MAQEERLAKLYQTLPEQAKTDKWTKLRVTSRQKMTDLISSALAALSAGQIVVLYDLPLPSSVATRPVKDAEKPTEEVRVSTQLQGLPLPDPQVTPVVAGPSKAKSRDDKAKDSKSSSTIGKMISIAEIIKRSCHVAAKANAKGKGKAKSTVEDEQDDDTILRVHQYNRIGCLEELGYVGILPDDEDEVHGQIVQDWLVSGKVKRPKKTHTPYMVIVLHAKAISALSRSEEWSHQPPPKVRRDKRDSEAGDGGTRKRQRQKENKSAVSAE